MKRITLTHVLEQYAKDYLAELKSLGDKPEDRLIRLHSDLQAANYSIEADYVDVIVHNYDSIITAKPDEMSTNIAHLFSGIVGLDLSRNISLRLTASNGTQKAVNNKFYKLVVKAMGYDDVQEKIFPKYIKKMGIKSCVYCNAQYAVVAKKGKTNRGKTFMSTYTLDHCLPKSNFPYLASSFFNLYPCCSTCNQFKSNKSPVFRLYVKPTDSPSKRNPFIFHLDIHSFLKYSMSGDPNDLKVTLVTNSGISAQELDDFENCFHTSMLYTNYNDTVEEVIWKYRMYNKAGRKALYNAFATILPHPTDFNRFILGNYDREEDMQKRPLAKLVQDVAKQLGIL